MCGRLLAVPMRLVDNGLAGQHLLVRPDAEAAVSEKL